MEELLASLDPGKAALVRRYVKTLGPSATAEQHQYHLSFSSDDSLGSGSQERAGGKKQPGESPIASTELGEHDDAVVFVEMGRCQFVHIESMCCLCCVCSFA